MRNYWNIKPLNYEPRRFRFHLDTDRDGVLDYLDCAPFNPHKHRVEPSKVMRERIKKLPIYVTEKEGDE